MYFYSVWLHLYLLEVFNVGDMISYSVPETSGPNSPCPFPSLQTAGGDVLLCYEWHAKFLHTDHPNISDHCRSVCYWWSVQAREIIHCISRNPYEPQVEPWLRKLGLDLLVT